LQHKLNIADASKYCCTILNMGKPANGTEKDLDIQILVGVLGVILSVVLHELFHILVHWNHIQHISLFPSLGTIVQIDVLPTAGSDIEGEELIAYGITLLVLLITVMIIYKIRDTNDKRSTGQILFPKDRDMRDMDPSEMLELSGLDETRPTHLTPAENSQDERKKPKK
jgi:hypothetical protein